MIKNVEQLENIINELKEKYLKEDTKTLNFDNDIQELLNTKESIFNSNFDIYDGTKTYFIEDLNVHLYIDYHISYENSNVFDTCIYIEDIFYM